MSDTEHTEIDGPTGTETTGHTWDGIKELDTPLPRWWLWTFHATGIWAVIYMIFMPAIPGLPGMPADADYTRGLMGDSQRANVMADLAALDEQRSGGFARLSGASIETIEQDPELLGFVRAAGRAAFGDNCATCHGSGAQGFVGYPNLNDDIWLWGGSYDEIRATLRYGIRAEHPETRYSMMPAFGRDELLTPAEIRDVADYVLSLSGSAEADEDTLQRGDEIYQAQCASCHMPDGVGDRMQGAPDLTDAEWLYGGQRAQIIHSIHRGPFGVMPAWEGRLNDATIDALAAYVYLLGGGETGTAQAPRQ